MLGSRLQFRWRMEIIYFIFTMLDAMIIVASLYEYDIPIGTANISTDNFSSKIDIGMRA